MTPPTHTIRIAAQRTGLSAHVIRIWEKRYSAVTPVRTGTNRRRYSDVDIARLTLLRELTLQGHNIGCIAQLPTDRLNTLRGQSGPQANPPTSGAKATKTSQNHVEESLQAIRELDQANLDTIFHRAMLELGGQGFLIHLAVPLARALGEAWQAGTITSAHEHFASAALKGFLNSASRPYLLTPSAPTLVVATPAGQIHEIGAAIVAAAASNAGWKTTYLGPNLPAADLAGAARQNHAHAVALSIVYPDNDPHLHQELTLLRRYLPPETTIVVGGRASEGYAETLEAIGAARVRDLQEFFQWLSQHNR